MTNIRSSTQAILLFFRRLSIMSDRTVSLHPYDCVRIVKSVQDRCTNGSKVLYYRYDGPYCQYNGLVPKKIQRSTDITGHALYFSISLCSRLWLSAPSSPASPPYRQSLLSIFAKSPNDGRTLSRQPLFSIPPDRCNCFL